MRDRAELIDIGKRRFHYLWTDDTRVVAVRSFPTAKGNKFYLVMSDGVSSRDATAIAMRYQRAVDDLKDCQIEILKRELDPDRLVSTDSVLERR